MDKRKLIKKIYDTFYKMNEIAAETGIGTHQK